MKTSMRKTTALICALALTASPVTFSAFPAFAEEIAAVQAQSGSGEVTQEQIEKNIIGTWIMVDKDGASVLTNEKPVHYFVSTTEAYSSLSIANDVMSSWSHKMQSGVNISGNTVTLTADPEGLKLENQLTITDMNADTFTANEKVTRISEDGESQVIEEVVTFVKVDDLSEAVLGTWEGKCTSEGSVFDDGKEHRWEYKPDGTYVFYNKDGDKWVADDSEKCEYFVAGNLLCTRWTKDGTENREWWEISVKDGKMSWTALRADEKGSTYTATFEMNKVEESASEVTQEQIEKNIIGTWILAEINGKPVLTNEKPVLRVVSPDEAYSSISLVNDKLSPWRPPSQCGFAINGDQLTITAHKENGLTLEHQLTITEINSDKFTVNAKSTLPVDTSETIALEGVVTFVKVDDLSEAVLGTWEGKCTSESSVFDDGKEHRWKYKADGTYVYYNKVGDEWVADDSEKSEYFVAGNLLCTRWTKNGTENREWWEISVKDGKMSWTALRADEKGSTYTATFELNKVSEVTQEQIEKNIVGTWILAEEDGKAALTNDKSVFNVVSPTIAYHCVSLVRADDTPWKPSSQCDMTINGNVVKITDRSESGVKIEHQLTITEISADKFTANGTLTRSVEGSEPIIIDTVVTFVKADNLSDAVLGTWEGKCTSEGSVFDDGKEHRWEYKPDGSYVYYNKEGDEWVPSDNTENEYFIAGNLLCMRWVDNGTENREWWEIGVKDGKMSWNALRANVDGSTYTSTFEMQKFITPERMWEMAVKDYQKKHGNVALTAENGKKNLDGTVEVILKDEAGNIVETYTVDARTGVGTDSKQNAVNLPQTGINGMGAVAAVGSAVLMTAAGAWMMFRSSRKKDEDV